MMTSTCLNLRSLYFIRQRQNLMANNSANRLPIWKAIEIRRNNNFKVKRFKKKKKTLLRNRTRLNQCCISLFRGNFKEISVIGGKTRDLLINLFCQAFLANVRKSIRRSKLQLENSNRSGRFPHSRNPRQHHSKARTNL